MMMYRGIELPCLHVKNFVVNINGKKNSNCSKWSDLPVKFPAFDYIEHASLMAQGSDDEETDWTQQIQALNSGVVVVVGGGVSINNVSCPCILCKMHSVRVFVYLDFYLNKLHLAGVMLHSMLHLNLNRFSKKQLKTIWSLENIAYPWDRGGVQWGRDWPSEPSCHLAFTQTGAVDSV